MLSIGDVGIVNDICALSSYRGELAIVIKHMGQDPIDLDGGYYFKIQFSDGRQEILTNKELSLLSKAERK